MGTVKEFLKVHDKVEYKGHPCKVVRQFKNRRMGQMVDLISTDGNYYKNVPFNHTNIDGLNNNFKEKLNTIKQSLKSN